MVAEGRGGSVCVCGGVNVDHMTLRSPEENKEEEVEEAKKSTGQLPLTSAALFESGGEQSDLITGSNPYSHLTFDLPSSAVKGNAGKSAACCGSGSELWIR